MTGAPTSDLMPSSRSLAASPAGQAFVAVNAARCLRLPDESVDRVPFQRKACAGRDVGAALAPARHRQVVLVGGELGQVYACRASEPTGHLADRVEDSARLGSLGDQRGHLPQRGLLIGELLQLFACLGVGDRGGDQLGEAGEPGLGGRGLRGGCRGQRHHRAPQPAVDDDRDSHRRVYPCVTGELRGDLSRNVGIVDPGRTAGMVDDPGRTVFVQPPRGADRVRVLAPPHTNVSRHPVRFEADDADQWQIKAGRYLACDDGEDLCLGCTAGDQGRNAPERRLLIRDNLQALAGGIQVFLGPLPLGDVADIANEGWLSGQVGPGNGQLGRELAPVGAQCRYLDPPTEDARLAGRYVPGETEPVCVARRWRHERLCQLPAEDLIGPVAEDALGRGIDVCHAALLVDADDAVECCLENRAVAGLAGGEFRGPGLGDLTLTNRLLGGPARGQVGKADDDAVSARRLERHCGVGDRHHGAVLADPPIFLGADRFPRFPALGKRALLDRERRPVRAFVVDQPVPVLAGELASVAEAKGGDSRRVGIGDHAFGSADVDRLAQRGQDRITLPEHIFGLPPLAEISEGDYRAAPAGGIDRGRPVLDGEHRPVPPHEPVIGTVDGFPGRAREQHGAFVGGEGGPVGTLVVHRLVTRLALQL